MAKRFVPRREGVLSLLILLASLISWTVGIEKVLFFAMAKQVVKVKVQMLTRQTNWRCVLNGVYIEQHDMATSEVCSECAWKQEDHGGQLLEVISNNMLLVASILSISGVCKLWRV